MTDTAKSGDPGGFAPLRHPAFRAMWGAQFASNIGGWMQTVGAQWLMLSLTPATSYLAFIQTAASLPVLLFAIPAGAAGDLVDVVACCSARPSSWRRRPPPSRC